MCSRAKIHNCSTVLRRHISVKDAEPQIKWPVLGSQLVWTSEIVPDSLGGFEKK